MANDEARINLTFFDSLQEWPHITVHGRLAGSYRKATIDNRSHREFIDHAAIYSNHRNHAGIPDGGDGLPQSRRSVGLHHRGLFDAVVRSNETMRRSFHPHRVNTSIRPPP